MPLFEVGQAVMVETFDGVTRQEGIITRVFPVRETYQYWWFDGTREELAEVCPVHLREGTAHQLRSSREENIRAL